MNNTRDEIIARQELIKQQISDSVVVEKGKKEMIGTVKEWQGKKVKKVSEGKWVPVGKDKGAKQEDVASKKPKAKEEGGKKSAKKEEEGKSKSKKEEEKPKSKQEEDGKSETNLDEEGNPKSSLPEGGMHYKDMNKIQLSEAAAKLGVEGHEEMGVKDLRAAVADKIITKNIKAGLEKMRKNKKEKEENGEGKKLTKTEEKSRGKIREWLDKQKEDYDLDPEGASFLRKKAQGIVQGVKHEIHEWKLAGQGIKKFMTQTGDLTSHEKKAIRNVAIHVGIVVALAVTGGSAGGTMAGKAAVLGKKIALGYLEHSGLMVVGHSLAFAKGEIDDEEAEAFLQQMIEEMADFLEA